jgi:hypothetical protein
MPYIAKHQRQLEFKGNENILIQAALYLNAPGEAASKGIYARDFIAYLIDRVYDLPCFDHSSTMAASLSAQLILCANYLSSNIVEIEQNEGGREGLLNYTLTRLFNEAYPSARYKDYNQISGILTSLICQCHQGQIDLMGMLACCRDEYYRKYAAPYEDLKESENGAVGRPVAPAPTQY